MTARRMLYKVPEITIYFWVIKCLCTTADETFSDDLVATWAGGNASISAQNAALLDLTFVTAGVLAITLAIQFTRRRYIAPIYWLNVVLISVFGTQLTITSRAPGWSRTTWWRSRSCRRR